MPTNQPKMYLPNFLIVGAAKSGTTSLANYLKQHPQVCISSIKEPKYFTNIFLNNHFTGPGDKHIEENTIKHFNDYLKIFSPKNTETVIGEASADLLYYSKSSIPVIKEYLGNNVKIIILLRNPIERAFSAYTHLVRDSRETLSFSEALNAEEERIKNGWEFIWHYKNAGKYYSQVSEFINSFSHVKIHLYDDFSKDPLSVYKDICRFLSIDDMFTPTDIGFKYNLSGIPRFKFIGPFLRSDNIIKSIARPMLPRKYRSVLNNFLFNLNLKKQEIDIQQKQYLIDYFREEISDLSTLLGRNLSHWLT